MEDSLTTFAAEALDNIFADIKERLQETSQSHARYGDHSYTASDIDLRALVDHFSDCIGRLQQRSQATASPPSAMLNSSHLTAPTAIDPATTISVSEASFSPAGGDRIHHAPRNHGTTTTIVSGGSITEIT